MNSFLVEVDSHIKSSEYKRKKIESSCLEAGLENLGCLGLSQLYRLEGELNQEDAFRVAKEILCDSVAENFQINPTPKDCRFFVDIWYKKGVTDSVGESVVKAVQDIGVRTVSRAAHGERLQFMSNSDLSDRDSMRNKVVRFVETNLLNPLVQECKITGL